MAWPRIVAEALRGLPFAPPLHRPEITGSSVDEVIRTIEAARRPTRSDAPPPSFLRPGQVDPWRRVMAALDRWHGALLAEPVGTGKTWIALAVAAAEPRPALALVPAIVRPQWEAAASRARLRLHCWTHERASRGQIPSLSPSLVIIDEAHRFRDRSTRRVKTVAPWLIGRRTLLLTATPIVNRLADLITLLQIALPDDALRLDGLDSFQRLADSVTPPPALRRVIIRSASQPDTTVTRAARALPITAREIQRTAGAVEAIRSLSLSPTPGVKRLLVSVLLDAAASSDAAFRSSLTRLRALLLQSRDAGGASRRVLRQFAGEALDQLVMWELVCTGPITEELPLDDIPRIEALLATRAEPEDWIGQVLLECRDTVPTVCFARHRATAAALRRAAGDEAAWVAGSIAGIGPHRMAREVVLSAFGPERSGWRARRRPPLLLIATDVAAEGLDLQSAGRVLHVDLPWTATRLAQREGRLLRIGQEHAEVEVITRSPAPPIEEALRIGLSIRRKSSMSERWLAALERTDAPSGPNEVVTVASAPASRGRSCDVVAVELREGNHSGVLVLRREAGGEWTSRNEPPHLSPASSALPRALLITETALMELLDSAARAAVALGAPRSGGAVAGAIARIHRLAREAARQRAGAALTQLDRLLRFATSSHTLGERLLLEQLATLDDAHWRGCRIPERPLPAPLTARPVAALLFRSRASTLR